MISCEYEVMISECALYALDIVRGNPGKHDIVAMVRKIRRYGVRVMDGDPGLGAALIYLKEALDTGTVESRGPR